MKRIFSYALSDRISTKFTLLRLRGRGEERKGKNRWKNQRLPLAIHPGRGIRGGDNGGSSPPRSLELFFVPPAIRVIEINFFKSEGTHVLMISSHNAKSINAVPLRRIHSVFFFSAFVSPHISNPT